MKLFQIQWSNHKIPDLMSPIKPFGAHQKYREYTTISNYIENELIDENELIGFFSPKFFDKTKFSEREFENFIKKKDSDIYLFNAFPHYPYLYKNIFDTIEEFHLNSYYLEEFKNIFSKYHDKSLLEIRIPAKYWCFNNFIITKGYIWKEFYTFYKKIMDEYSDIEKEDVNTNYPGVYSFIPFIFERLFTVFIISKKKYVIRNFAKKYENLALFYKTENEAFFMKIIELYLLNKDENGKLESDYYFEKLKNHIITNNKKINFEYINDKFWIPNINKGNEQYYEIS